VAGAKNIVGREKRNQNLYKLQVLGYRDKKQLLSTLRRTLDLKVSPWGGGKRSQLIETPHLSFLPSVAASCVGLFFFFLISKLEILAIKLVEIGSEKHKFPNIFLLKRGNFVFKKH
jgi:hypothetical protein